MKHESISIECSKAIKNILCESLRNYAHFSKDENNQPFSPDFKQTVLDIADMVEQQFIDNNQCISLSTSSLQHCKKALNYHYNRIDHLLNVNTIEQRRLMLNLLNGTPAYDRELDIALTKDNLI